ncbi:MAG TPA: SusC/RagA family TonB-linked outer membrane protein [Bacteroidales bacterium]|nr:SusC/RagA family TonB-linked outer membrane protein [Bacteroidales bacterium]
MKNHFPIKYLVLILLAALVQTLSAQNAVNKSKAQSNKSVGLTVKGKVIDLSTKQGFAGARVSVVNTQMTTMSNSDGQFELNVPNLNVTLLIDAPGYNDQIVALKGSNYQLIKMLQKTIGQSFYNDNNFHAQKSVTALPSEQGTPTLSENITSGLIGQVYGANHSGMTGSGSSVFVHGLNSLNATAQPLYVVDGVVWQMSADNESMHAGFFNDKLSLIDPNDVEKITVLKSGTSLYGAKGANGVILIDTKRAHNAATEISATISSGFKSPFQTVPVMNASEYRLYASDIVRGMYDNSTAVDKLKFLDDNKTKPYYNANHNQTDWLGLINGGAMTQNYGVRVKGGSDVALIALSLGYNKTDGNIQNTGFDRFNVRFNSDIKLSERLKLAMDVAFTQASNSLRNDGIDSISSPYFLSLIKSPLYNPHQYNNNGQLSARLSDVDELRIGNPLSLTQVGIGRNKQYGLNTILRPEFDLIKDKLKLGFIYSFGWNKLNENSFTPDGGVAEQALFNEQGEIYAVSRNKVQDRMDVHTSQVLDGFIRWNALQNAIQSLKVFGGYRFDTDTYKSNYANGYNTGSDNMTQLTNTTSSLRFSDGVDNNWKSISWYANADYAYQNKYLLNISMAMDASSRLGKKAESLMTIGSVPWGLFPSATVGWVVSSEEFMSQMDQVNFLKLTAGYDVSGNDGLPDYASRSYFESIKYRDKANGLILGNVGNEKLLWETTGMAHAALDLSLFDNKWSIRTELYSSRTNNLLVNKKLNEYAGLLTYWSNGGSLQNTGFDISTTVRVLDQRAWKMDLSANIGHYKNTITSLNEDFYLSDVMGGQVLTKKGLPAGVFYGYKTLGVFSTTQQATDANLSIQDRTGKLIPFAAGDMHFENLNTDQIIDAQDKQVIGNPNPDFYGNFMLNVTHGNFKVNALFTYVYGNDIYNALRANLESGKTIYNQTTAMQNRWVANGQETDIPRATYGDPMGNARFSDRWIEDGSYLRFKTLSMSYDLPIQSTFVQGLTIWGAVNNLYTLTNYLGADPEVSYGNSVLYQGIDAGLTPQTRSFNLGVTINL